MSILKVKINTSRKGQATVEFALAALLFFTAFLAIVEFAHLFYTKLTLQHALREAGRFMITGSDGGGTRCEQEGAGEPVTGGAVVDKFYQNIKGIGGTPQLTIEGLDGSPGCGGPSQPVTLTATYTKPWFSVLANEFLPGGVPLSVSMTWVNEPFPGS